jgi:glycosyltransferase involved in cell wall biosynthesis
MRPFRLLFITHLFKPRHNSGSESYLLNLIKYLQSKGNICRVLLYPSPGIERPTRMYVYEGIDVVPFKDGELRDHYSWAERIFCHLAYTTMTIKMAAMFKKPVYHITHTSVETEVIRDGNLPVRIIYNSQQAARELDYPHPSIVLQPFVNPDQFDIGRSPEPNKFITLINLTPNKGGNFFAELALKMPSKKFLGMKGSYGHQVTPDLPNVTYLDSGPNIMQVYEQTRILLMPSKAESWGMTAREAMCSGIPVICTDLPGLRENCGDAAIYLPLDNIDAWIAEIKRLDNKKTYLSVSEKCKNRASKSDPNELTALDQFLTIAR